MKTLNVMDLQFNYKAALRGYESVVINREWNGIGSMELVISTSTTNADQIAMDDILWFDNEYHKAFIVEKIEAELAGNEKRFKITATSINALIRDYLTIPPAAAAYDIRTGVREAVARAWITQNCISPADMTRVQYPIILGTYRGLGGTITEQTRLNILSDEISRILATQDLGWRLELDIPNKRFIFQVYEGTDRTAGQSLNGRVLFGLKYGNISSYRKVDDTTAAKTVAYAGGQGDGAARTIVKADGSGSGRKKEVFIDARDLILEADLAERAAQTLAGAGIVNSFEFEVLDRQFRYGHEYDLGDYVTVVLDMTTSYDLQIQKVREVYDKSGVSVTPEFGKSERTLGGVIGSVAARISKLETTEFGQIKDSEVSLLKTWSSQKIKALTDIYDLGFKTGAALPATAGAMTATMDGSIKTITPTGACTFNAAGGQVGQRCTFIITTSGVTSYTLTWGTNFKAAGTLATGTVTAKKFSVNFIYDGATWVETGRTAAM